MSDCDAICDWCGRSFIADTIGGCLVRSCDRCEGDEAEDAASEERDGPSTWGQDDLDEAKREGAEDMREGWEG